MPPTGPRPYRSLIPYPAPPRPPFNIYGTTEGLWGVDCEHHEGIHFFEDMTLLENVDADNRSVPPGEPGARLLLTGLHNLVQPIIRLEVSDVVTLDPDPCPCGRTLVRTRAIEGRGDDVLRLPARAPRRGGADVGGPSRARSTP